MKFRTFSLLFFLSLTLSGCGAIIRSEVTVFHQWPTDISEKTFVFDSPKTQEVDLEYLSYQKLVAVELKHLGFSEANETTAPKLKVSMEYRVTCCNTTIMQSPYFISGPRIVWPTYYRAHRLGYRAYYYDPFWMDRSFFEYNQWESTYAQTQLHIDISEIAGGKKLYEATVDNADVNAAPALTRAFVMPYIIRSAFKDFPGKSGVPHRVQIKAKD